MLYSFMYFCSFPSYSLQFTMFLFSFTLYYLIYIINCLDTAIICLKQLCTSSPSLLFDSSSTLIISLKELLLCYQKCIVNDSSQIVNACSDLFITILTMKLNSLQPYSIPSLWKFLCELTTPVMGDAPLSSLVQQSVVQQPIIDNNDIPLEHTRCHSPIVMEEEEWMWQVKTIDCLFMNRLYYFL